MNEIVLSNSQNSEIVRKHHGLHYSTVQRDLTRLERQGWLTPGGVKP